MSLKEFDSALEPDEDSYETPQDLFERIEKNYNLNFIMDVAANKKNTKCALFLRNALHKNWNYAAQDVWCNPPHSMTEQFVRRADNQHRQFGMSIAMIVPTNCQSTIFWHELIENETEVFVENHPIKQRPHFLKNGRKTKFGSRNAYRVIIWRKK